MTHFFAILLLVKIKCKKWIQNYCRLYTLSSDGYYFFAVKTVFEHKRCHLAVIVKSPLQQVQHPCWCYFGKWNPAITFDGSQFFPLLITVVNFLEILQALINQLPRCPNLLQRCMPVLNCYFLLRKT